MREIGVAVRWGLVVTFVLAGLIVLGSRNLIFVNRRRTQVKLLVWMRGGFTILHRRLERGRFTFPARVTAETLRVEIDAHELAMLLEGLDAASTRSAARWDPPLRSIDTTSALV